ncbi:MAG: branched-chain amino acid ABC transporter permease [Chloroflexi bacterium]|nr:branched-chain amino acid ABC transporter permease [Chloroflexota bacterium]MBV9895685.1 branched-chain amino acid ABC transporter permease [Chloroflexota bacterium]
MTTQARVATQAKTARRRQSPQTIFRNAFLVTFLILLAIYPVIDGTFGWGKMGAMPAILIYTMLALGLNIVVGFAGLLDLGYVAFFAIGGYTAAFLTSPVSPIAGVLQVNFYVAMALAFLVAATFGIILGAPTLRLRGDYLAIVTLAFGEIVPRSFLNLEGITRGSKGMIAIGRPIVPTLDGGQIVPKELYNSDQTAWYYLIFVIGVLSVFAIYRLANSRIGRAWMALREDELAAASMGIDLIQTKLLAFALGASFAGFAGSLWASMLQVIDPFQFDFSTSIIVLSMIILGGIGNLWGVIFGGVVLGFYDRILTADLTNWVHQIGASINVPVLSNLLLAVDFSQYKYGIFGVALVLLMLTRPEGIFPNRQRAMELHGETPEEMEQLGEEALSERTVGGVRA